MKNKLLFTVLFFSLFTSSGWANPIIPLKNAVRKAGSVSAQVQRNVARSAALARKSYVIPTMTVKQTTQQMRQEIVHQNPAAQSTFVQRPIDKLRHSISSQTTIVGSEKKDAFRTSQGQHTSSEEWRAQQRQRYYSNHERRHLQELLNGQLFKVNDARPDVSGKYALEDYLYKQGATNGLDTYLAPMYRSVLKAEADVRAEVLPCIVSAAFSEHEPRLDPRQLNIANEKMFHVIQSSGKLLYFLPNDTYLKELNAFYSELYKIFNPLIASVMGTIKVERTDGRLFNFNEFFLFNPEGKDYVIHSATTWSEEAEEEVGTLRYLMDRAQQESEQLLKQIPQNWHIAVLNDDAQPLQNFKRWAQEGRLGAGATVSTFEDGNELLQSISKGTHYDLIITDILVPNGGRFMMPALRNLEPNTPVIAMSKYTRERVGALNLFESGMDGYLPYTVALNNPEVGYWEYLRALNNYLQMKNAKGWAR